MAGEYEATRIIDVLERINSHYFLPHIQRPFVWSEDQIVRLFDSLLRGYPIGTFLFWKLEKPDRAGVESEIDHKEFVRLEPSDVPRRKFIQNYSKKLTQDFNIERLDLDDKSERDAVTLVLDGQQRLQSLYTGLHGSYDGKELYFNILSGQEENDNGYLFEFKFYKNPPKPDATRLWYGVGVDPLSLTP